jgi:hypothetical protein
MASFGKKDYCRYLIGCHKYDIIQNVCFFSQCEMTQLASGLTLKSIDFDVIMEITAAKSIIWYQIQDPLILDDHLKLHV